MHLQGADYRHGKMTPLALSQKPVGSKFVAWNDQIGEVEKRKIVGGAMSGWVVKEMNIKGRRNTLPYSEAFVKEWEKDSR